jgi:hypothetical protein
VTRSAVRAGDGDFSGVAARSGLKPPYGLCAVSANDTLRARAYLVSVASAFVNSASRLPQPCCVGRFGPIALNVPRCRSVVDPFAAYS